MTLTDLAATSTAASAPAHPLASLTATEIEAVRAVVLSLPSTTEHTRLPTSGSMSRRRATSSPGSRAPLRPPASPGAAARHALGTFE